MTKRIFGFAVLTALLATPLGAWASGPISPSGSLNIQLQAGGSVTSNSANNALLSTSTVTVSGTRFVYSTAPVGGVFNLGIVSGDLQTLLSSGIYGDGNYTSSATLDVAIDGLEFDFNNVTAQYLTIGSSAFQNFEFTGQMDAGTNSNTSQQYTAAPAELTFTLSQASDLGGTISYGVTITVPAVVPEPASLSVLGAGLLGLGLLRRHRSKRAAG